MYDYDGPIDFYQNQLLKKGITKEMLDLDDYSGLTARELQGIVDHPEYFITEGVKDGR